MIFYLIALMIEKVGIIVIVAFLLSQMKSYRQVIHNEHKTNEKTLLILLFGAFGVISNYTGIEICVPMIFVNGFGMLLFMFIIQSIMRDKERVRANKTSQAFHIADQTKLCKKVGIVYICLL